MNLKELMELKQQIESTKSEDGLGIGEREFTWMYEPGKPIRRLQEIFSLTSIMLGGLRFSSGGLYQSPSNTNAIAIIHNHPSNDVHPSYWDVKTFLSCISKNPRMRYSLIAATGGSEVHGYFIMTYRGRRSEATKFEKSIEEMYRNYCNIRQKEIRENPERFDIKLGECIFSLKEERYMSLKAMSMSKIVGELFPMPGHKTEDWKFIKI